MLVSDTNDNFAKKARFFSGELVVMRRECFSFAFVSNQVLDSCGRGGEKESEGKGVERNIHLIK